MSNESPEKISRYMAERLKRENKEEGKEIKKEKLKPEEIEDRAYELIDLTLEKQDLMQAKISDEEKLTDGKEPVKIKPLKLGRGVVFDPNEIFKTTVEQTEEELNEISAKIAVLSSNDKVLNKYQEIMEEKIGIIKTARQVESKKAEINKNEMMKTTLLAYRQNQDKKLTAADKKCLNDLEKQIELIQGEVEQMELIPEVKIELRRRELLEYRNQLLKSKIVETPSVKEEVNKILAHLELGIPVFLRGHLGAGKTEICLHVARKYFGVEPELISGSEEATKYDIYGKTQIGVRAEEDKVKEFQLRMEEFKKMCPDVSNKELKDIEKQYYEEIVVKGQSTSFFQYGPLVRAMKEGKPLVIDEMDGIPHSILMRLNHVLTRRQGDVFKIQENGGEEIEVKKGFCVMATGNIKSAKYKREDLDAAFLSRWWSDEIKYLPQEETFKIITASLVDKRGNLEGLENLEEVERLTKAAEEIQRIFTGEKTDVFGEGGDATRGVGASLEKSVLSMRDIWNIVKPWKAHNFDKSLEDYIYDEFIKKSTVDKDQVYLTQLFCRFGFFKDWEAEQFKITGLDKKKLDAFKATKESKKTK